MKYPVLILTGAALLFAAAPPPPSPPPLADSPSPAPVATANAQAPQATPTPSLDSIFGSAHRGKGAKPSSTPTPPPNTRVGIDGVWEIQIQKGPQTTYEHMKLVQTGDALTGYYLNRKNQKWPINGSIDAEHELRLVVSRPDGTTILMQGTVDGTTDMLGMFTDAQERVPFTASYRAKEKWTDNINAAPAGYGGGSPGGP